MTNWKQTGPAWFAPNPWMERDSPLDEEERRASRPPPHEVIEWHLSFFAEAYLPSHSAELSARLKKLGWSARRSMDPEDPVSSLRSGPYGGGWTRLRTLLPKEPQFNMFDAARADQLPDGVASLQLWLWSVTPSLTVLVVGAEWDENYGDALDRIAKTEYPSMAVPSGNGYQMYSPAFRTRLEAETCRRRMRKQLSSWLAERLPGAFTDLNAPLPFVDVITAAIACPFTEDTFSELWDYRELLGLDRPFATGTSPSLPGWTLAMPDSMGTEVPMLGARTVEVFSEETLGRFSGGESRWAMEYYLSGRLEGLLCGWTTLELLDAFQKYLALTRDRAPARDESASAFAKRLAKDDLSVLRRGADAAVLCADIQSWPPDFGPAMLFRNLDFTIADRSPRASYNLRKSWEERLKEGVGLVSRLEQDQRARLSTIAEVSGVAQNVRTQARLLALTVALLFLAALTIALTIVQLTSDHARTVERVTVVVPRTGSGP